METIFQIFLNGELQYPKKIHSALYAEELYDDLKKHSLPGTHILVLGTTSKKNYVHLCTIREHLLNKKIH